MTFYEILIFNHHNGRSKVITCNNRRTAIRKFNILRKGKRKFSSVTLTRVATKEIEL